MRPGGRRRCRAELGDQRLDGSGLLGHREERPGALHDLAADRRVDDPLGHSEP
jgi:hypothetical protein